jgi:hypothetical protein
MGRFNPDDDRSRNGGILGIELNIEVTSRGTNEELERVQQLFREKCILYLFAKSATEVIDNWKLVSPS